MLGNFFLKHISETCKRAGIIFIVAIFTVTCSYNQTDTSVTVTAVPVGQTYAESVTVTLSASPENSKIYYSTNPDEQLSSFAQYLVPITITQSATLRFFASTTIQRNADGIKGTVGQKTEEVLKSAVMQEIYVISVPTPTDPVDPTIEPTPTVTATLEPTPDATATPEPTATVSPEPTATASPAPTATVSPEPTATPTPVPDTTPPGAFAITSPTGSTADNTPDVVWQAATDATSYTLNISVNSNCSSPIFTVSGLVVAAATVTSSLPDGNYYLCVLAYDVASNAVSASNNALSFTVDTSAPPALVSVNGGFGNANEKIEIDITYPANVSDYSELTLRRTSGNSAPSNCASGSLATTINSFTGSATVAIQDTVTGGTGTYSYRACISDAMGNVTSSNTVTAVKIRTGAHRAFVTSQTFGPKLSSDYDSHSFSSPLEGADYRCQYAADHATSPLGGKWKAILSGYSNQAAVDRINIFGPISNINADMVANSVSQFWSGSLTNAINRTENNATLNTIVWTGSNAGGGAYTSGICENWSYEISTVNGAWGSSLQTSSGWIYAGTTSGCSASDLYSLYCIEQPMPNDLTAFTATTGASSSEVTINVDFPADTTGYGSVIVRKRDYGYPAILCNGASGSEATIKTYNGTSVPFTDGAFTHTAGSERRQYYRACVYDTAGNLIRSEKVAQARAKGNYLEIMKTVKTYDGNMGGLAGADTNCQTAATVGKVGGTWQALLSDETTNAKDRFSITIPVLNFLGLTVAVDSVDMFNGSIGNSVGYQEQISSGGYVDIFTGSLSDGTKSAGNTCSSWTSTSGNGKTGYSSSVDTNWLSKTFFSCSSKFPVYCLRTGD